MLIAVGVIGLVEWVIAGCPHSEDERLYAFRDCEMARMERDHKALKRRFRQA